MNGWNPSPSDEHLFQELTRNLDSHKFNDDPDVAKVVTDTMAADVGQDSSVGVATRYGLDGPGIESRWRRDFPHPSRPAVWPAQPPVQWVPGLFPRVKRPRRGNDHPPHLPRPTCPALRTLHFTFAILITQYTD
jgi:hypothetical protein